MGLLHLVLILIVIGVLLYLFNTYVAQYVDSKLVKIINVVVVIVVVLWLIGIFFPSIWMHDIPVTRH